MARYQKSEALQKFFEKAEKSHHAFWDHFWGWYAHDAMESSEDRTDGAEYLFDAGFDLARKAGDKPVFRWESPWNSQTYTYLYFIGEEAEILANLESELEELLEEHPNKTEEQLEKEKLERERLEAQKELEKAQAKVQSLDEQLK